MRVNPLKPKVLEGKDGRHLVVRLYGCKKSTKSSILQQMLTVQRTANNYINISMVRNTIQKDSK